MKARLRPCDGDLAPHDQLAAVLGFEDRFDGGEVFAGANQVLGGAAAEQQADRFDEDRFAGAGLAGEDVERLFKVDRHRLDHREVADGQVPNHAGMPSDERNCHRIMALTEFPMACYGCTDRALPAAHPHGT